MATLTLSVPNCNSSSTGNMPSMKDLDYMTDTDIALCLTKEERKAIGVKVLSSKLGTGGYKLSSGPKRYCDACRLPLLKHGDLQDEFCAICEEIKKTLITKMMSVDTSTTTSQATSAMFSPIAENSAIAKGKSDNVGVVDDSVTDAEERDDAHDICHTMNEGKGSTNVITHHDNSHTMNENKGSDNASHDNNSHIIVNENKEGESVVDKDESVVEKGETTIAQQSGTIMPNKDESQADVAGNVMLFDATTAILPNENENKETRSVDGNTPTLQIDTNVPDENISEDTMGNSVREESVSKVIPHEKTNSFSAMCAVTLSSLICHHESVCNGGNDVIDHPQEIMDTNVIHNDTCVADEDKNEMTIIEDASEDADEFFDAQLNNLVGNDQTTQTEEVSSNLIPSASPSSRNYELFLSSMAREKEEMKILLGCTPCNQKYNARSSHHIRFHSI
jgi:NCAIR mutase (PurE)-related protein